MSASHLHTGDELLKIVYNITVKNNSYSMLGINYDFKDIII